MESPRGSFVGYDELERMNEEMVNELARQKKRPLQKLSVKDLPRTTTTRDVKQHAGKENIRTRGNGLFHETSDTELKELGRHLSMRVFVCSKETLPDKLRDNMIINLDDDDGSHWCAIKKIRNKVFYFDPFGAAPPTEVVKQVKKEELEGQYSTSQYQILNSSSCGQWCIFYLYCMKTMTFPEFLSTLTNDLDKNEAKLEKFFSEI